ncbi:MAG: S8 family serine peptidase [Crocinitomicaceae bacterium]|nr:S8 family serine peptidase [Crocinitomicaceae bacterium]
MKKIVLAVICTISLLPMFSQDNIVAGELLVMFKSNKDVDVVLDEINRSEPEAIISVIKPISERINIWHLSYNDNAISKEVAINLFAIRKDVEIVQFNHNNVTMRDTLCPNDIRFNEQWNFYNDGVNGSGGTADISACDAWSITTGGTSALGDRIVVAVIDGGFDVGHNDINFFNNAIEASGSAGVDDDGNGYVDDVNGWDAGGNDGALPSAQHGTHVSGTVGAIGNNNLGVTGVNWDVDVLPVATNGGSGFESTVLAAYGYVLEMRAQYDLTAGAKGAFVVSTNSSFGIDNADPASYPMWCAFYDSLGAYGILSAGATANNLVDIDAVGDVPTACPSDFLISVTNTTQMDGLAFAGYGLTTIDMGAPGTDILSTNPSNNYGQSSGTSMATPHVAGTIGLMWSAACSDMVTDYKANPSGLALTVRNYLLNDGLDQITALSPTGSNPTVTGGRLNLHKSVVAMSQYSSCPALGIEKQEQGNIGLYPNPASGIVNVEFKEIKEGSYSIELYNIIGERIDIQTKHLVNNGWIQLNYDRYSSGQYVVKLKSVGNGIHRTFKLILN